MERYFIGLHNYMQTDQETRERDHGEGAMREGGFEGICLSITNEKFWSNSATCSCTVELREVVHFRGFLRVNELKKICERERHVARPKL
jgi:hypothetical protein